MFKILNSECLVLSFCRPRNMVRQINYRDIKCLCHNKQMDLKSKIMSWHKFLMSRHKIVSHKTKLS